jgi:hypothetical protein
VRAAELPRILPPLWCGLLALAGNRAAAATLSSESSVSLASEYNSNPYLLNSGANAAEAIAALATLPATYTSDAQSFEVVPSVRFAETHGNTQLLTDYQYLNADWHLSRERDTYTVGGEWHRDSTFYNVFENAELRGHTLPRLEESANAGWSRALTERSNLQLAATYDQVNYDSRQGFRLGNFNYGQASLEYDWSLTERWTSSTAAGYGRYELRQQDSTNENRFAQTSLTRALSEQWSASAQVGYSRVSSSAEALLCCAIVPVPGGYALAYIPVKESSSGGIIDYSLSLERRTERWTLDVSASRSVQPSSLGALLTEENAGARASFALNERLQLAAGVRSSLQSNSLQQAGAVSSARYDAIESDITWQWTEHWTLALQGTYSQQRLVSQGSGAAVSVTLSRQFGRIRL